MPPKIVSGVTADSRINGVEFSWDTSEELDHKCYYGRTQVSSANWGSWKDIENNIYTRVLSSTEASTYSVTATVAMEVKDKDWYGQTSDTAATISAAAGETNDELYSFKATMVGGTGDVADLYNDILKTGGVNF